MTIQAESADGVIHEFPDGTAMGVVDRAMADYAMQARLKAADTQKPSMAEDTARGAASGLVAGATGAVGMPGSIGGMMARGGDAAIGWLAQKMGVPVDGGPNAISDAYRKANPSASGSDIQKQIEAETGSKTAAGTYQPSSPLGRIAKTGGEFAGGALIPGSAVQRAAQVIVPTIGAEVGGAVGGPIGRAVGGGIGSVGPSMIGRAPYMERRLGQAAGGVTRQQFDDAAALAESSQARDPQFRLPPTEAIQQVAPQARGLGGVQRIAESAASPDNALARMYAERPAAMTRATDTSLDQIAPRSTQPGNVGRMAQEGAENALERTRQQINRLAEPYYNAAENVPIPRTEMAIIRSLPGYEEALATVRGNPQLNRYVAHLPDESVGVLNEVKKQLNTSGQNVASAVNPNRNVQVSAGYARDARDVNDTARSLSPDYANALDIEAAGRSQVLSPQQAGPLGTIAGTPKVAEQGRALLGPGASPEEVTQATQLLMRQNPDAARGVVREGLGQTANRTVAGLDNAAQADQYGGAKFARDVRRDRGGDQNTRAAIEAAAGGPVNEDVQRLIDALQATGNRQRPGSLTTYNTETVNDAKRSGLVDLATKPLATAQEKYGRMRMGSRMDDLTELLATGGPEGVRRVQELAGRGSDSARILVRALLAERAATQDAR